MLVLNEVCRQVAHVMSSKGALEEIDLLLVA